MLRAIIKNDRFVTFWNELFARWFDMNVAGKLIEYLKVSFKVAEIFKTFYVLEELIRLFRDGLIDLFVEYESDGKKRQWYAKENQHQRIEQKTAKI